nr:hypothetical protein TQ38_24765 [Novosphingobium sp. P6W]
MANFSRRTSSNNLPSGNVPRDDATSSDNRTFFYFNARPDKDLRTYPSMLAYPDGRGNQWPA